MKKFTKVAAILAASAILFGGMFMSCSDSDDSNDGTPSTPVSDKAPAPAVTFTSATKTVAKADLGEATAASVESSDSTVATATVSEGTVTIVSVKAGSATITATAEGYNDASIPVTVAANGAITLGTITKFAAKSSGPASGDGSLVFDFTTDGGYADKIKAVSGTPTKTNTGISDGAITISENVTLAEDTASGIKVILVAAANTNLGNDYKNTTNFKYNAPAVGLIIKNSAVEISGVKGKVKVTLDWGINGKKTANDRKMGMKLGTNNIVEEGNSDTSASDNPTSVAQTAVTDTYDFGATAGSIYIGATNELGIKSIKIESAE